MKAIRKFDEDDSGVLGHGKKQLPVVLHLLFRVGQEFYLSYFRHPVHDLTDLVSEVLLDIRQGDRGILHYIVDEGRDERCRIQLELGQERRHLTT